MSLSTDAWNVGNHAAWPGNACYNDAFWAAAGNAGSIDDGATFIAWAGTCDPGTVGRSAT